MTDPAPDLRNDAIYFLQKHSDLTYSASVYAVDKLCSNGFYITRTPTPDPAAIREAALREALQRIGTLITPTSEDRMNGHEDAYRAIEALIGEKK